ncbi:MAG: ABC transporter permease, partial [Verrucomicrobia bacterium]|nr:ABC transporter permease [Verrucomicrobiota bacterium]
MSETGERREARGEGQIHLSPNQKAWRRFKRNRLAVACGLFLLAALVFLLVWPVISSHK